MSEITITLGGRQFALPKLPIRAEAEWRSGAKDTMAPLLQAGDLAEMQVNSAADIARAVAMFADWLDPLDALQTLIAYAPQVLEPEREWLETHAYSDEVIGVLLRLFFVGPARTTLHSNGVAPARMQTT